MLRRAEELDAFKRLNLTEIAASEGYELDRKASSRNSAVMVNPAGDKIVIARAQKDGHWMYFSVRDERDNGSVIDFLQNRRALSLGQVRKELRPWLYGSTPLPRPAPDSFVERLEPLSRDLTAVRARFAATRPIEPQNAYLTLQRCVPPEILTAPIFEGRIHIDGRSNVIFPHWNRTGLCGFEITNQGFKGFSPAGTKGLWGSRPAGDDDRLVIAESALDALSYATLKGLERSRFVSIAGQMNPDQPDLLRSAMNKLPGGRIILAMDHDEAGQTLAAKITALFEALPPRGVDLGVDRPPTPGEDFNDVLRASVAQRAPLPRPE